MRKFWVNVYRGAYADCLNGKPYYVSLGHRTKIKALKSLDTPKGRGIHDRYIATVKIEIPDEKEKASRT